MTEDPFRVTVNSYVTYKYHMFYCDWILNGPCNKEGIHFYIVVAGVGSGAELSYITVCDDHDSVIKSSSMVAIKQKISYGEFLVQDLMEQ